MLQRLKPTLKAFHANTQYIDLNSERNLHSLFALCSLCCVYRTSTEQILYAVIQKMILLFLSLV